MISRILHTGTINFSMRLEHDPKKLQTIDISKVSAWIGTE